MLSSTREKMSNRWRKKTVKSEKKIQWVWRVRKHCQLPSDLLQNIADYCDLETVLNIVNMNKTTYVRIKVRYIPERYSNLSDEILEQKKIDKQ